MERLTEWANGELKLKRTYPSAIDAVIVLMNRLAEYEDTGLTPEEVDELAIDQADKKITTLQVEKEITALVEWLADETIAGHKQKPIALRKVFYKVAKNSPEGLDYWLGRLLYEMKPWPTLLRKIKRGFQLE